MTRLFLPKIQPQKKVFQTIKSFRYTVTIDDVIRQELSILRKAVETPRILPSRFYRAGVDSTPDQLLEEHGIMHLHIGSPKSRELFYLIQYPDRVVLLEISDHYHFETDPTGGHLLTLHKTGIAQNEADAEQLAKVSLQRKKEAVKLGLLPRKPRP